MLTIKEVSKLFKVCPQTVYRWIKDGDIVKPMKIGRSLRWQEEDIENWLESRKNSVFS